jgi:hypothetical protein
MEIADSKGRALLWGYLLVTLPAVAAIPLVLLFRKYLFVPGWPYYVITGTAIGYQWYAAALPRWRMVLRRKGISESEVEEIARQGGLVLPGASAVGLLALHTAAAALCATDLNPWFAGRIVHGVLPLIGAPPPPNAIDFYLRHFELVSVIPAFLLGYVISRKFPEFGSWAWLLPTIVMSYKLLTFADPHASVFAASDLWHRFSYYFVIEQLNTPYDLRGLSDPERWLQQITVVAPFYSSVAYSVGALVVKSKAPERISESLSREPEPKVISPEAGVVVIADDSLKHPLHDK